MPNNPLVFNVTRKYRVSLKQARKAVELCSCAWVDGKEGLEVRDLSISEAIAARNVQAREREIGAEILVSCEIPGLMFKGPTTANQVPREVYEELDTPLAFRKCNWPRLKQANQFCQAHT